MASSHIPYRLMPTQLEEESWELATENSFPGQQSSLVIPVDLISFHRSWLSCRRRCFSLKDHVAH
jgi:hypothetical protein